MGQPGEGPGCSLEAGHMRGRAAPIRVLSVTVLSLSAEKLQAELSPQVRCCKVVVLRAGSGRRAALELGVPEP